MHGNKQINIRFDRELFGALENRAIADSIPLPDLIRELCRKGLGLEYSLPVTQTDLNLAIAKAKGDILAEVKQLIKLANKGHDIAPECPYNPVLDDSPIEQTETDSKAILAGQGINQKELCEVLGVSRPTINKWLKLGLFEEMTKRSDGSYFQKIGDRYYQIFPSEKSP